MNVIDLTPFAKVCALSSCLGVLNNWYREDSPQVTSIFFSPKGTSTSTQRAQTCFIRFEMKESLSNSAHNAYFAHYRGGADKDLFFLAFFLFNARTEFARSQRVINTSARSISCCSFSSVEGRLIGGLRRRWPRRNLRIVALS
jgi:hypothetical protein